ncbi:MAG: hypothetical protein AAFR64_09990 [Pseudomonadota bacterium]
MILSVALLASAQAAAPLPVEEPASEPASEIVVIGRLRSLQASVGQDKEGRWHCSLSQSTGRPKLDDKFCRAVTKCVQKGATQTDDVRACIEDKRARLVRDVERAMKKDTK